MKDERVYVMDILECIQRIELYTRGGRVEFLDSVMAQDAVIRKFEIIGEAVKQLSEATRIRYPEVPWRRLAGFRDVLIHEYPSVDVEEIWNIIERHLPALKQQLEAVAKTMKDPAT